MRSSPLPSSTDWLDELSALYAGNRILDAWRLIEARGGLPALSGPRELVWAGRILGNLGVSRAASLCLARARRVAPTDVEVAYYTASRRTRFGPLRTLAFLDSLSAPPDLGVPAWADLLLLRAAMLTFLRDFSPAEQLHDEAERLAPGRPWGSVCRSQLLDAMDRPQEALALVERTRAAHPEYRPAVEQHVELLLAASREEEALSLLEELTPRVQVPALWTRRAHLEELLGRPEAAWDSLEQALALTPWLERRTFAWFAARRSDLAARLERWDLAIALGHNSGAPFHVARAERMETAVPSTRPRRTLPVPFVRQHHLTCAPAAIASVAAHWRRPIDHLALAREITWDGTSHLAERRWLETHGWVVREFRATRESVTSLLDRGVPVLLSTHAATSAHAQVIIGDDARRGVLILRDPSAAGETELDATEGLDAFAASGPRALAAVPQEEASLLEGLSLPDATGYDLFHEVERALDAQRLDDGLAALTRLEAHAPEHRLTILARRRMAGATHDLGGELAQAEALLALHPTEPRFALGLAELQGQLGVKEAQLATLRKAAEGKSPPSAIFFALADALAGDARNEGERERLLRRATRTGALERGLLVAWADLRWNQGRRSEALPLYRFAACMDEMREPPARSYFTAARLEGRAGEALEFLESRFRRAAHRAGGPALTLAESLDMLGLRSRASAVLVEALAGRPEDPELQLGAARLRVRWNELEEAERCLEASRGKVNGPEWHTVRGGWAEARGALDDALAEWRTAQELAPHWDYAQSEFFRVLTLREGAASALAELQRRIGIQPTSRSLRTLAVEASRELAAEHWLTSVDTFLELAPDDAWGLRERALALQSLGRLEEALTCAERAIAIEPANSAGHNFRGRILIQLGRRAEGRLALRESLARDVDNPQALTAFLIASTSPEDRAEAVAFLGVELRRAEDPGAAAQALQAKAAGFLEADPLLALLEELAALKPGSWGLHAATVQQLLACGRLDEALVRAAEACRGDLGHFPGTWLLNGDVLRQRGEREAERELLQRALERWPHNEGVLRALAEVHEHFGDADEERSALERLVAAHPQSGSAHGMLADLQWRTDARESAWESLVRALRLDPAYEWGWRTLVAWSRELERQPAAESLARELARGSGASPPLMAIAELLEDDAARSKERLAALDEAAQRSPTQWQPHEARAALLAELGHFDEALKACSPPLLGETPPLPLRGRRAAILWQRGQREDAVMAMVALAEEVPDYQFALRTLVDWHTALGNGSTAVSFAQRLVQHDGGSARAQNILGEALVASGDREGAITAFEAALAQQPENAYALLSLFDELLALGRLEEAEQILERSEPFAERVFWEARAVQLAARRGEAAQAMLHYERTLRQAKDETWPISAATTAMEEAGLSAEATRVLARAVTVGKPSELLANAWAERVRNHRPFEAWRRLRNLPEAQRVRGQSALLQRFGSGTSPWFVGLLPLFQGRSLRRHVQTWGALGYALLAPHRMDQARKWLRAWRLHPDAEPWMLSNVVYAFAVTRPAEAQAALARALSLPPDHVHERLRGWALWFEARSGSAEGYATALAATDGPGQRPFERRLRLLSRAVALGRMLAEPTLTKRERFAQIKELFASAASAAQEGQGDVNDRGLRRQALWRVRNVAGVRSLLWALLRIPFG